jgi:hypothetical protein
MISLPYIETISESTSTFQEANHGMGESGWAMCLPVAGNWPVTSVALVMSPKRPRARSMKRFCSVHGDPRLQYKATVIVKHKWCCRLQRPVPAPWWRHNNDHNYGPVRVQCCFTEQETWCFSWRHFSLPLNSWIRCWCSSFVFLRRLVRIYYGMPISVSFFPLCSARRLLGQYFKIGHYQFHLHPI